MQQKISSIVIYSVGLLGGSLGYALKNSGFGGRVIGLSSPQSIEQALKLGCIDEGYGYEALADAVSKADILFLCSPIGAILDTLERLGSLYLPHGLIISDIGSTKTEIMKKAKAVLPKHVHFIGGHPMAGSEKKGVAYADPYLFQNAIYVLTLAQKTIPAYARDFAVFLEGYLGCRHLFMDAKTHDTIVAMVSHVPHILAVALVNVAKQIDQKIPGTIKLAAGGFRDMTRIASSPYQMWHDIIGTNTEKIEELLDCYIKELQRMKKLISTKGLAKEFDSAAQVRRLIPLSNKGFISPLNEVLVMVKDQPGMIAKIASALAKKNINIKDIEVLKIREGEGGTLRIAFESRQIASEAVAILNSLGFSARERE